jgi:hypothetical protein
MRNSDITGKLYRRGPRQYNLSAISEYLTISTTPFHVSAAAAASLDVDHEGEVDVKVIYGGE